jgi:NADPH2:quinone reductase
MRAARLHAYGPPETLVVEDLPDPVPGAGEALVDVAAASVNYPDVLIMADKYQVSVPLPFTPGSEYAGVVRDVGTGVSGLAPGDHVFGSAITGAFASCVVSPAANLRRIPPEVSLREASGFWVTYGTAYHALRTVAEVAEGEWVAVLGAAGGVGLACVEVAQLLGGRVVAAASSREKLAVCAERGAEALIDYSTEDLKNALRDVTGGGAHVVIDPVGGHYSEQALRSTRWGGRFVTVGYASGEIPRIPLNLVLLKGVVVKGFEIRTFGEHLPDAMRRNEAELLSLFAGGRLHPYVSEVHPLERTADALRSVADRRAIGKVVIEP